MAEQPEEKAQRYRQLVRTLTRTWPRYDVLNDFLNIRHHICQLPAKVTVVTLGSSKHKESPIHAVDIDGPDSLCELLRDLPPPDEICRLFLVENLCPDTIALLGGHFNINPQFFTAHVSTNPWYRISNATDQLPILPSGVKALDFLQLRYIVPLIVSQEHVLSKAASEREGLSSVLMPDHSFRTQLENYETRRPETTSTRICRLADRPMILPSRGLPNDPLLFTQQFATIRFSKSQIGQEREGWTEIILLDTPFHLNSNSQLDIKHSMTCDFGTIPSSFDLKDEGLPLSSPSPKLFLHFLKTFLQEDPGLVSLLPSHRHIILEPLYQIISRNWLVVNEFLNRQIIGFEYWLQNSVSGFTGHESHLKDLHVCRRLCLRHQEKIRDARTQRQKYGQSAWHVNNLVPSQTSEASSYLLPDLDTDFEFLVDRFSALIFRIDKNINLITSLVTIGQAQQSLLENHLVARLTLLATFFLPFSLIATILSIQGDYGPGGNHFWLLWIVALPATAFIVLFFKSYSQIIEFWGSLKFETFIRRRMGQDKGQNVRAWAIRCGPLDATRRLTLF